MNEASPCSACLGQRSWTIKSLCVRYSNGCALEFGLVNVTLDQSRLRAALSLVMRRSVLVLKRFRGWSRLVSLKRRPRWLILLFRLRTILMSTA